MNDFKQLIKNLCYLSKFSIKTKLLNDVAKFSYEEQLENFLYYIPDSSVKRPRVLSPDDTIHKLLTSDCSISRFGDGELAIIDGKDIPFQIYDKNLAERMKDILKNRQKNLMVGINYEYFFPKYSYATNEFVKQFALFTMPVYRKILLNYINFDTCYFDSKFTCPAEFIPGGTVYNKSVYDKLKTIWNQKKILIVCCENAVKSTKFNIYDNAKQIDYLYVPNKNAYSEYVNIMETIKRFDRETIIILMCGPLASVLTSDLTYAGYRALDLGHLMKTYDFYKQNVSMTEEMTKVFYASD